MLTWIIDYCYTIFRYGAEFVIGEHPTDDPVISQSDAIQRISGCAMAETLEEFVV